MNSIVRKSHYGKGEQTISSFVPRAAAEREKYFGVAGISDDDEQALALMGFLDPPYLAKIEYTVTNLPATRQYEKLKSELIRVLTESDSAKVERLVEREEMGDRKPSQFYNDLKKLASPLASDEFILNLWRNRLPDRIREVLAAVDDASIEKLTRTADRIDEAYDRIGQRAHRVGTIAEPPAPHADKNGALAVEVSRLREEIKALKIGGYRRPRRRSNSLTRPRRRSRSRDNPRQDGICFYHARFGDRATKCTIPCKWKSGNDPSRP